VFKIAHHKTVSMDTQPRALSPFLRMC